MMRLAQAIAAAATAALAAACAPPPAPAPESARESAPESARESAPRSPPASATPAQSLSIAADVDPAAVALAAGVPVVAEFGANVCAACREMKTVLAEVKRTRGAQVAIVEVNALKQRDLAARYRVQLMPTQVFFDRHGREVGRNVGRLDAAGVLAKLDAAAAH